MYLGGLANTVSLFGGGSGGCAALAPAVAAAPTWLGAFTPFTAGAHTRHVYCGGGGGGAALCNVDGIAASVVALS